METMGNLQTIICMRTFNQGLLAFVNKYIFTVLEILVATLPDIRVLPNLHIGYCAGPPNLEGGEPFLMVTGRLDVRLSRYISMWN
jgi:hypothetical protein